MNISLATKKDATQIAIIHKQEINQGFLSQLGVKFLSKLYKSTMVSPNAFTIVAKDNDKVIGFISGCTNVTKFYHDFFKKYFFQVFFILLPKMFRLSILKKIFETLKYPQQKEEKKLPGAELLTIAILKQYHGRGIAQKMFEKFVEEIKKREISEFKVIVGENLPRAIAFYEKIGFKFHSPISIHTYKPSKVYIYKIK